MGEIPFCIGIVGDFSGRGTRAEKDSDRNLPHRRLLRVTPERVMTLAGLSPRIHVSGLPHGLPDQAIRFSSMEDFHPDEIFRRLDLFAALREARERALAGNVGDLADAGHRTGTGDSREATDAAHRTGPTDGGNSVDAGDSADSPTSPSGLLDAVLGQTERGAGRGTGRGAGQDAGQDAGQGAGRDAGQGSDRDTGRDTERQERLADQQAPPGSPLNEDLDAFLRRVVAPYAIKPSADVSGLIEDLDQETGRVMRAIMHSPAFRDLEALWRGVVFLMSRIQVSTNLRVYLIDVSEGELVADLLSSDDPTEWGFAHTLLNPVSENGEELRWAALLGCFRFGSDPLHVPLLQRIGLLCESGGVPWFGEADTTLLGATSLEESPEPRDWKDTPDPLWQEFRERPEAEWISLSLPGFLLRPPYGPEGRKVKQFRFHEAGDPRGSEREASEREAAEGEAAERKAWERKAAEGEAAERKAAKGEAAEGVDSGLWGNPAFLMGVVLAEEFRRSGWSLRLNGRYSVAQLPTRTTADGGAACLQTRFSHSGAAEALERGLNPVVGPRHEAEVHFGAPAAISASGTGVRAWWENRV